MNYAQTNYTVDDGLPSNECHDILQDSLGYIWIATDRGLVRFDGYEFKTYGKAQGLKDISCLDMQRGMDDVIWVLTVSNRIFFLNKFRDNFEEFQFPKELAFLKTHIIDDFIITDDNRLVISCFGVGFIEFDLNQAKYKILRSPSEYKPSIFSYQKNKKILLAIDESDSTFVQVVCNDKIEFSNTWICQYHIFHQNKNFKIPINVGKLFNATGNPQVFKIGPKVTLYNFLGLNYFFKDGKLAIGSQMQQFILDIEELEGGELLVGEKFLGGLKSYRNLDNFHKRNYKQILNNISISSIFVGENQTIWCSSLEKGIYKLNKEIITPINRDKNANINQIEIFNNKIYYLKDRFELKSLEGKSVDRIIYQSKFENYHIVTNSFIGKLIVAGQRSFSLTKDEVVKNIFNKHKDGVVYPLHTKKIIPFNEEGVLTSGPNNLLKFDSLNGMNTYHSHLDENKIIKGYSFINQDEDKVLIGTENGFSLLNQDTLSKYPTQHEIFNARITSIHKLRDNYLISVLGGGLVIWDLINAPIVIDENHGLLTNNIEDIIPASSSSFFICSKSGMSYISFDENFDYQIKNYTTADGLPSNEVNDIATLRDTFYIATGKGLAYMTNLKGQMGITKPIISDVKVNGNSLSFSTDWAKLEHKQNDISVSFTTLDYSLKGDISYRYKTNDTDWQETRTRTANFNELSPGAYTFEVQSRNSNNIWGESAIAKFEIKRAWWNTYIFRGLLAFFTLLLLYLIYKWRIKSLSNKRKIEKEVNDLERAALQAQMNPHFIFNCLNSIQSYIYKNDKELAMEYLSKFSMLIRQNLNASRENKISLTEEILMLENYLTLEQIRLQHKFTYSILVEKSLDQESIRIPSLLIQPFVENSIKHGISNLKSDGWVKIEFKSKAENQIEVSIKDNGKKKSLADSIKSHRSYGSKITSKRLAFINKLEDKSFTITPTYFAGHTEVIISIAIN
jgi:hypothetical protein